MSIDVSEMIVPTNIAQLPGTEVSKIINYYTRNGNLLERVEAFGQSATVFRGDTNVLLRKYQTDFKILNAIFVTFSPKTPEEYLCLVGESQIDFYAMVDNNFCSLALPFKICQVHLCSFGLILERNCFSQSDPNSQSNCAQLYSLTHPFNEIFPILCKIKNTDCFCAFQNRRLRLVPKELSLDQSGTMSELVMAYDFSERTNHIFMIRKCSKEEHLVAKHALQPFSSTFNTPNSLQQFYSPNFFLRKFERGSQDRLPMVSIPSNVNSPFTNTNRTMGTNDSGSTGSLPRLITPVLRRTICTRSMAAASHSEQNLAFGSSSTINSLASSLERSMAQGQRNLYKLVHENSLTKKRQQSENPLLPKFHSTPIKGQFDDDLLSFGDYGNEPANSLDLSVEFCLELIWSERLEEKMVNESSNALKDGTISGAEMESDRGGNINFENNESSQLNVICSPASSLDHSKPRSRLPSAFFITEDKVGQRFVVFHVPSDRKITVLKLIGPEGCFPEINEHCPPIRAYSTAPFLSAPYFVVLERTSTNPDDLDDDFAPPVSPSGPSIALYSGTHKLGNVALNFSSVLDCSQLMTALRTFIRVVTAGPTSFFLEYKESGTEKCYFLRCGFQLNPVTHLAEQCLKFLCEILPREHQMLYLSRYICTNPWRIIESARKLPGSQRTPVYQLEMCLLLEHFLSEIGIDPSDLPFLRQIVEARCSLSFGQSDYLWEETLMKKSRIEGRMGTNWTSESLEKCWQLISSKDRELGKSSSETTKICIKSNGRHCELSDKAIFKLFTVLHDVYESLKLDRCFHSLLPAVAETLFVFSIVYQLNNFTGHYKRDFPQFESLFQDSESASILRDNTNFTQKFRKHTDLMETVETLLSGFNSPASTHTFAHFYQLSSGLCPIRVLTCLAVALGRIRSSKHLQKYLGKTWTKRLRIDDDETVKKALMDLLDDESLSKEKKCCMCMNLLDLPISQLKFLNEKLFSTFNTVLESDIHRQQNWLLVSKLRIFPTNEEHQRSTSLRWREDIRLHNTLQMLDCSLPILIPANPRTNPTPISESQLREQHEQFLVQTAVKTITRPFGQALINFRTKRPMPNEPVRVQPICLNGRVNPGRHQVKFPPTEETSVAHKLAMDWASFYNGVAHGLAVLGFESAIGRGRVNKRYGRDKSGTDGDGNRSRDISGTFLGLTLGAGCGVNVTTNTTNIPSPTKLLASKKRLNKGEGRIRGGFTCGNISNLPNSSFSANLPEVQLSINVIRNGALVPQAEKQMVCNSAGLIDHPPLFGSVEHSNSDVPETPNAVISLLFSSYKEDEDSSESEEQEAMGQQHPSSSTLLISALTASGINKNDGESVVLDWDWLSRNVFKANENVPTVQAGLLLAAGLTGHIRSINLYDVHTFLSKNDRFVSIALLIGCAVAFKGTADVHMYKVLATHLPFMLQPTLCELKIESCVQTASVVSLGLLFSETANLSLADQLLNQMSLEVFEGDQCAERYAFVLATGFAIGLINLGKGREIEDTEIPLASSHFSIKERLIKLLNGGERKYTFVSHDKVKCPAIRALMSLPSNVGQMSRRYAPGPGSVEHFPLDEDPDDIIQNVNSLLEHTNHGATGGMAGTGGGGSARGWLSAMGLSGGAVVDRSGIGAPPSNHVRERPNVNIHMTSPAACAALGLMYLRTGDRWIIDALTIPDNFHAIDKIRPDMLMIRTLCRCLVDFKNIGTSVDWVFSQIPAIVRKYVEKAVDTSNSPMRNRQLLALMHIDIVSVSQAFFYCAAGACFAMCLRHASTWNKAVFRTVNWLYGAVQIVENHPSNLYGTLANKAGRNCVAACTNVAAICFGLVMAGSGDLQTMRMLRKIRNFKSRAYIPASHKDTTVHSLHAFANMALGLLYLGHGQLALSRSNSSIASLLIAFFPLFSHAISDNRIFFQPLRFLWSLALEPRFLTTVDSQTLEPVSVSLEIIFKDAKKPQLVGRTPALLPPVNTIASIRLAQKPIDDQKGAPSSSLSSEGRENNYDYYDSGGCRFLKEDIKMELDEESESAATAASSESDSSWSSSELDDDDSDSDNEEAEGENLDSGGTLRRRRRIGLRNQQKRRRYENPTPPRYTAVQLDLSVAGDLRKLKEVLCRFYGRLPLNRKAAAEAETSSSLKTL